MPEASIKRSDVLREIDRLKRLVEEDPDKYGDLRALIPDEEYEPEGVLDDRDFRPFDVLTPETGEIVLAAQKISRGKKASMLDQRRAAYMEEAARLTSLLKTGVMAPVEFNIRMREELKDLYITAYVIGKGADYEAMQAADWGRIGNMLRNQYGYLRKWLVTLNDKSVLENTSSAQIIDRLQKYAASASQAMHAGSNAELGIDPSILPAQPGDGTTDCMTRCKCRWAIRILSKARGDFNATWRLGIAEHCRTCRARARDWVSLEIRDGQLIRQPTIIVRAA